MLFQGTTSRKEGTQFRCQSKKSWSKYPANFVTGQSKIGRKRYWTIDQFNFGYELGQFGELIEEKLVDKFDYQSLYNNR